MIKVIETLCPGYVFDKSLDLVKVGECIDGVLLANFAGKNVVLRGIQSGKHEQSKKELIALIAENGTDRTDSESDNEAKVTDKKIDLFGMACRVEVSPIVLPILEGFHKWKPKSLERPQLRVDIWMVYDAKKLENVEYTHSKYNVLARDGYLFKDSNYKKEALLGVLIIS